MILSAVYLTFFILFSAFFSAAETAIFSLRREKFRQLKERHPSAKRLNLIFRDPEFFLSTIVFGNMLVNIGLSSLLAYVFVEKWGGGGVLPSILFSGIIILFFGEVFPKNIAIYTQETLSLAFAPVLLSFAGIVRPLIRVVQNIVNRISYLFFVFSRKKHTLSEEELKEALFWSKKGGHISEVEEEMISYLLEFKDTQCSEIMTPRVEIKGLELSLEQDKTEEIIKTGKHSKLPVYQGSLDNIIGVIYSKEVFLNQDKDWKNFLRKVPFVPESKKIDDLLKEFVEDEQRIAIVLDEYGGTSGLVTMEDVKEEIFGEIYDEFEVPVENIDKIGNNLWRLYGKIPIKTVNLELALSLPEQEDTLAGFILSIMERIPHPGEKCRYENVEFLIEKATAKRIVSVNLRVL